MSSRWENSRALKPDNVVLRTVGSETVLLDVETGRYFTLNDVGTRVWTELMTGASVQSACDALSREFDADPVVIEADVDLLLTQLEAEGLVEIVGAEQ